MKVIVCGGRDFDNEAFIFTKLDRLHESRSITDLMQGGATGADAIARQWAKQKPEIRRWVCRADWKKYGRAAGPKRNQRMLEWEPDLVVAFPGNDGTADMVGRAEDAGVEVIEYA